MMTITEKAAYIKGLVDGIELDESAKETKIIKALVDIIDDMALSIADAEDDIAVLADEIDDIEEHLEAVDVDLADVEDLIYDEYDDEDYDEEEDFEEDDDTITMEETPEEICPRCGSRLVEREGPYGVFWGCTAFPRCRFTKNRNDSQRF